MSVGKTYLSWFGSTLPTKQERRVIMFKGLKIECDIV